MTSAAYLKTIHTLKTRARLEEDDFRSLLVHHTGQASTKALSDGVAGRFIEVLKGYAGQPASLRPRADRATGKYAEVLQALWISAFHLAIVHDRTDAAMMAWVKRQTKVEHTRFLTEHAHAQPAIEGLKKWIGREAGVTWPSDPRDGRGRKAAVVQALARRLVEAGGFTAFLRPGHAPWPGEFEAYGASRGLPAGFAFYDDAHWVQLMIWLGESLRAALMLGRPKGGAHG